LRLKEILGTRETLDLIKRKVSRGENGEREKRKKGDSSATGDSTKKDSVWGKKELW